VATEGHPYKIYFVCFLILLLIAAIETAWAAGAQQSHTELRVAVVGFGGNRASSALGALAQSLKRDGRVFLVSPAQLRPALAGVGYTGSINLSADEARRLGAAVGCDFFIVGKSEAIARSERERQLHGEAIIAVMIVDARSGALAAFDFISEKAATTDAALEAATKKVIERAAIYFDLMREFRAARSQVQRPQDRLVESIEEIPDPESALAAGFKPPEFLVRVKPDYTEQAERADISATVEALAVFRADGTVGDVEVRRWAGFGLDQSAVRAIRQLKFKPATRDGKPTSVRAMVRYNFRRLESREPGNV
jgi:TonB family protein